MPGAASTWAGASRHVRLKSRKCDVYTPMWCRRLLQELASNVIADQLAVSLPHFVAAKSVGA